MTDCHIPGRTREEGAALPTKTFFHLPPEKRAKLFQAALTEFARVPFAEASINRIIQDAGIPRGSFYMYFSDKEDLFLHVMETYGRDMERRAQECLEETGGDPFSAMALLFERLCQLASGEPSAQQLVEILRKNRHFHADLMLRTPGCGQLSRRLAARVDRALLDLREPGDLERCIRLLVRLTAGAVVRACVTNDPAPVREELKQSIAIFQRGMAAKEAPCAGDAGRKGDRL